MKNIVLIALALLMSVGTLFTSCEALKNTNNKQRGAAIGAAGGALLGGILGNNLGKGGNAALGAAIGAAVGGGAGGVEVVLARATVVSHVTGARNIAASVATA